MPSLTKPFAAFGAAAGLFAILALGSYRAPAREVAPLVPMLLTGAVAAGAGEVLRRWPHLHDAKLAREAVVLWITIVTVVAGAVSGGLVGLFTWGPDGVARFTLGGGMVAMAFVPSCLVVFDAAKRAGRARLGSLVAATDRRTVFSTVLAGIAFAGATAVPAVLSANTSSSLAPLVQVGLSVIASLGATIGIVVLSRRDRRDRASLESLTKDSAWLEPAHEAEAPVAENAVDLGLGADQWSKGDGSYRSSGRADGVLKGSIAQATEAFDECARRRHRSLIVAASALAAVLCSFGLRLSVFL
jgi:hypothetical protein